MKVAQSCPTLQPHGLEPARLLRLWNSPGKNTGVGRHFLLQGIFPTQGSNMGFPRQGYWSGLPFPFPSLQNTGIISVRDGTHPAPCLCTLSLTYSYFQGTRKCICKQTFKNTAPLRLLSTPSYAVLHLRIWKSITLHAALGVNSSRDSLIYTMRLAPQKNRKLGIFFQ